MRGSMKVFQWQSKITYPFTYLDSSYVLRSQKFNTEIITREFYKKHPEQCKKILKEIQLESQEDNDYYEQIEELQLKGRLSTLVTMETFNYDIQGKRPNQIALFGSLNNSKQLDISYGWDLEGVVLWEESVDFKTFSKAAIAIANAECIIADAAFFRVSVGKSLAEYIMTGCNFIIASTDLKEIEIEGNYILCELPPNDVIKYLSSVY